MSLPKIMSCTVVSATSNFSAQHIVDSGTKKCVGSSFSSPQTQAGLSIARYKHEGESTDGHGDCCNSFSFAPVGCFPIWDHNNTEGYLILDLNIDRLPAFLISCIK